MSMTTVTGSSILTPEQVHALVIQPLIDQSVAAQVSTVVQISSHDLRVPRALRIPLPRGPRKVPRSQPPTRRSTKSW